MECWHLSGAGNDFMVIDARGKTFDFEAIGEALRSPEGERVKVCFIQRSKGYLNRRTLTVDEIGEAVRLVKSIRPEAFVVVDNCYGEFTICARHRRRILPRMIWRRLTALRTKMALRPI